MSDSQLPSKELCEHDWVGDDFCAYCDADATRDMLTDARLELDALRSALGVDYEPHQSLHERMLDAANHKRVERTAPEPRTPLSDDQLIAIADQFDSSGCAGAIHRYRMRRRDMIALLRSFSATVEGLIRDGAAQPPAPEWQPIETAPKDGTPVLVSNDERDGAWIAYYHPVYTSGYRPDNPWSSLMLNMRWHKTKWASTVPTKWMPIPAVATSTKSGEQP